MNVWLQRFVMSSAFMISIMNGWPARAEEPVRIYFVGNSVTDAINYQGLERLAGSRGTTLAWGRHMIPGAPLSWIWQHPKDGFAQEPYGRYPKALGEYAWDVLSLEPFDRHLHDDDLLMTRNFIDKALQRNPAAQIYIYSRWPRRREDKNKRPVLDYRSSWLRKYTGAYDGTEETKDYFERLLFALRETYDGKAKPVLLVPVGDVLFELDARMKGDKIPGYTDVTQLYTDWIHFNNVGSYVVGLTFFATVLKENPQGLPFEPYNERLNPNQGDHPLNAPLARALQEGVWKVVSTHPLAGVRKEPSK